MKSVNMFRALLSCVVLPAWSAAHAQPRDVNVGVSESWQEMYRDSQLELTDEEKARANPCLRPDRMFQLHPRRRGARHAICVGRVKSRFVTDAWDKGLDVYGAQLESDAGAKKFTEMEIWLRSLAGKYRIEGEFAVRDGSSLLQGTAECFAVGAGAGVSCTINAKWPVVKETRKDKNLDKSMGYAMQTMVLLFGIDNATSRIRVTQMDFRAIRMAGFLVDDAVIFDVRSDPEFTGETMKSVLDPKGSYTLPLVTYTWSVSRVALKTTGDVDVQLMTTPADFLMSSAMEFDLKLRREPPAGGRLPRATP
jgi:hypothetical protein